MLEYFVYLIAGVIIDVLYTIWYAGVNEHDIRSAMLGSFFVTVTSYTILYYLLLSPEAIGLILAYAVGGSIGTGLTVWYKKRKKVMDFKQ